MSGNAAASFVSELTGRARRLAVDCLPDRMILARRFQRAFDRPLNLKAPQTFGEKLFWLMLHYRTALITRLADKHEVRSYVAERVGPGILNEQYGVWERVSDIDFEKLPDSFALKVTWGWRMNVLCPAKAELDVPRTRAQLASWMRRSHYWNLREWSYKNIKPRIICERLLIDRRWSGPTEYCFYCFAGEPRFVRVHTDRWGQGGRHLVDLDWQTPPFTLNAPDSGGAVPRPPNLDEMVACARSLSRGWPFVRVDLYGVDGRTIFGEVTWYPSAGVNRFRPEAYDRHWGEALPLPPKTVGRRSPTRR